MIFRHLSRRLPHNWSKLLLFAMKFRRNRRMIKFRDNLFISDYQGATQEDKLMENGITVVLNVAFEVNNPIYNPERISSFKVGLTDTNQNPPFMTNAAISLLGLLLSGKEKVLVHCAAGASRSVFVAVSVVSIMEDRDWHDVLRELQDIYPIAIQSPLFEGTMNPLSQYLSKLERDSLELDMSPV